MVRPKPPEPFHRFNARIPQSLWQRVVRRASRNDESLNNTVRKLIAIGLAGSPIALNPADPGDLPWDSLDAEDTK